MNPLLTLTLFIANLLALSVTLGVLFLAFSQHPGDKAGQAVTQFLAAVAFYNLTVMLSMVVLIFDLATDVKVIATNLSITGFLLSIVAAFSLVVSLAGMMKQAYQVLARAGFVIFILLLWPLWRSKFFTPDGPYYLMSHFAPAGIVASAVALAYILLTIGTIVYYRNRIEPTISLGIVLLVCGQTLAILNPSLRKIDFASVVAVIATAILGYWLGRMQLFNPLMMQKTQLAALRDVSHALTGTQDVQQVLDAVVQQSQQMLRSDMTLIVLREETNETPFIVSAQNGGSTNLVGRRFATGTSLAEHIFETKRPMRLQNYQSWQNQTPAFSDVKIAAIVGVPLLYDDNVLGALIACELKPGRTFSDRDQAMLEMLAPQAAVALMNAQLRQRISTLTPNSPPARN